MTVPFTTNAPGTRSGFVRGGLVAGMLAPLLFGVTVVGGGWLRPGFDQATTFVSELGETGSPTAWIVNPSFVLVGLLTSWFALALQANAVAGGRTGVSAAFGGTVARLFGVVGAAFVLMAVWTCSSGCPIAVIDREAAPTDALHNAAAIAAIASLCSAALLVATGLPACATVPGWYRRYCTVSGAGVAVLSAVFLLCVLAAANVAIGISERALLLTGLAWIEVTAIVVTRWAAPERGAPDEAGRRPVRSS